MEPMTGKKTKGVDAVDKALAILSLFGPNSLALSLTEISRRSGYVKSTAMRLLVSLQQSRLITMTPDKQYRVGAEAYRLGSLYLRVFQLEASVRPALRKLVASTGESASFFQRDGQMRVCLYREDTDEILREHVAEGEAVALDRGAAGHVLIDFQHYDGSAPSTAKQRTTLPYVSTGERGAGITGIAAPVFAPVQGLIGALTLSGPATRFTKEKVERYRPLVCEAAASISRELGAQFYD